MQHMAAFAVLFAEMATYARAKAPSFDVSLTEKPSLLIAFPRNTMFQQSQNPSFVPRSKLLPDGGLMVRLQNCSGPNFSGKGPTNHSGCNYGKGGGADCYGDSGFIRDHIGFLPFPKGYSGSTPLTTLPRVDSSHIIFSPKLGDPTEKWGTQDPQCAYDLRSDQYFLSYTAWAGPAAGWGQKAAVSKHPADTNSWRRLGPTFTPNNSWPVTPKGAESNIKCSALYAMPDPKANPRYYLYSGDVTQFGARVSSSNSLAGPWSRREQVTGGGTVKGQWDHHMGCFVPPVELSGALKGHLLTFYNAYPPSYPGPPGFQVGWAILNASDPTAVVARSTKPLMGHDSDGGDAKWMDGTADDLYCNDPFVVFMQSPPQPVIGEENAFRLYFGMGGTYVGTAKVQVSMHKSKTR